MQRMLPAILASAVAVLAAQLPAAQEYPHAFPRTGTVKLHEGDRVIVWEVNWIHGAKQPYHRHLYDMAGVYLRYGDIVITNLDGSVVPPRPFDVPRPHFQRKGITHREESHGGAGDPERLAIMIDLKDAAVEPFAPPPGAPPAQFPREGATNVLENERIRIWDYTWGPAAPTALHTHDTDTIEVFFTGGTIRTTLADGTVETQDVAFKTARFVPRGRVDRHEAVAGSPRAMVVELK